MSSFKTTELDTLRRAGVLVFLLAGAALNGQAGDPIDFSRSPAVATKTERGRLSRDLKPEGPDLRSTLTGPEIVAPSAGYSVRVVSPKEAKRQKDAAMEKKNWMILEQGQLQEAREEEEAFGLGSSDGLEKEKTEADYWWSPKNGGEERGPASRSSGANRLPGQSRGAAARASRAPTAEGTEQRRMATDTAEARSQIAREMDPKSIFSKGASSASSSDPGTIGSTDVFRNAGGLGGASALDGRQSRGDLTGIGAASTRGTGIGIENRVDSQSSLGGSLSAPFSPGLFNGAPRAAGGGFSLGGGYSTGFGDKGSLGSPGGLGGGSALGDPYGVRSGNSIFGNPPSSSQQPGSSPLSRSLRDERPKMPGQ